ncbi:DUF2470 domain-containing protein [Streptomyces sp. NPDC050504]|uniref:DUF2470 domain-containing protein n=1 Tax=Streptomyces sp. NPDC050504 TaxID=3365618 RepID=UPI0037B653D8
MPPFSTRATQPSAAERVRSVLAAAHSMTVVSDGHHFEVRRLDDSGAMSRFHLHAPAERGGPSFSHRVPVRLELTDIAPTLVRDRLRARVTVTGLLAAPYGPETAEDTCMEFGQATIEDAEGRAFVSLDALETTTLDPIAHCEASMLTHLVDDHAELVPLLLRLVRPRPTPGMQRAVPVAIDRYGLTLRLEYPRSHHDARLPFATPITEVEQAGPQIHALLAAARRSSHPNRLPA